MDLHSLLAVLMPYLAALYVVDCLSIVRDGHLAMVSTSKGGFRLVGPGLRVLGFLPFSWVVSFHEFPLPLAAGGVYAPRIWGGHGPRPWWPEDFELIPRGGIGAVSANGASLRLGARSLPLANGPSVLRLARTIESVLADGPSPADRCARAAIEEAASLEGLKGELDMARAVLRPLSLSSTALFLGLFVLLPTALYVRAFAPAVVPLCALWLAVYVLTVILFWRAHRLLHPLDGGGRMEILATLVLLPVGAAHATSKATRGLFTRYDWPLQAALLAPDRAEPIIAKEILRSAYSAARGGPADLVAFWKGREAALRHAAAEAGLRIEPAAPDKGAATGELVCPLCGSRYLKSQTDCSDCGVPLNGVEG